MFEHRYIRYMYDEKEAIFIPVVFELENLRYKQIHERYRGVEIME